MLIRKDISETHSIGILDLAAFSAGREFPGKRTLEKAGSAFVLKEMLGNGHAMLKYTPECKPYLEDRSFHVSISHSHDKLAVSLNQKENTGIDIELIRDKVLRIRHKFLSEGEYRRIGDNIELLIKYWAVKETLYKLHGMRKLDFIQNLFVSESGPACLTGTILQGDFHQQFNLAWEKIDDYIMVYALHEIK